MKYLSFIKFSHSIFAIPFAAIGFFEALKICPNVNLLQKGFFILLALISARTAAMSFNRIIDRKYDKINKRTTNREIPSGKISVKEASVIVFISSFIFIFAAYMLNNLCFYLSLPALIILLGYSYTKRFTAFSHFVLGATHAIATLGAYLAICEKFDISIIILSIGVMFWTAGFDIIYALQDIEFDRKTKLHSIPALVGDKKAKRISSFIHLISISTITYFWYKYTHTPITAIATAIFCALVAYQHFVIYRWGLKKIDVVFFTLNGCASLALGFGYLLDFII